MRRSTISGSSASTTRPSRPPPCSGWARPATGWTTRTARSPTWEAVVKLGETPSTYPAWRNLAAARVRSGDLRGAMRAYREADRRAPAADKAEIATRLGWLAKETGDAGTAKRYFARGRGDGPLVPLRRSSSPRP